MQPDNSKMIYIHGRDSDSQSGKARLFAQKFLGMLTPDFTGTFEDRMHQLTSVLSNQKDWTIIGSSLGGLMAAVFAMEHPTQVDKLILLAPALTLSPFASRADLRPVSVPTVIVHGTQDDVVPLGPVRELAKRVFPNLTYYVVQDDHRLHKAFEELDWQRILR